MKSTAVELSGNRCASSWCQAAMSITPAYEIAARIEQIPRSSPVARVASSDTRWPPEEQPNNAHRRRSNPCSAPRSCSQRSRCTTSRYAPGNRAVLAGR